MAAGEHASVHWGVCAMSTLKCFVSGGVVGLGSGLLTVGAWYHELPYLLVGSVLFVVGMALLWRWSD